MTGGEIAAALGPADDREEPHALLVQPGPLLTRGEVDVRLGPSPWPLVLVAVEARGAEPVLPGELAGVADAQPALLRGVDEEQPAERPVGLSAERLRRLLVEQDHPPTGVGELGGGDQPGQPGPHDDDVGIHPALASAQSARRPGRPAKSTTLGQARQPGRDKQACDRLLVAWLRLT